MATKITGTNTAAAPGVTGDDTDTGLFYGTDLIGFSTGGTERLRIDSSGKVGIGTASPARELHLVTAGNTAIRIEGGASHTCQLLFTPASGTEHQGRIGYYHANDYMDFYTAANERMRIDSSGRVLIGTTTEGAGTYAETFTIAGTTHCGMTIRSATNGVGSIYFSDGTSGDSEYRGYIEYNHTSDFFKLATAASERLRITSAGIVVTDNLELDGSINCGNYIRTNYDGGGHVYIKNNSQGANYSTHFQTYLSSDEGGTTQTHMHYYHGGYAELLHQGTSVVRTLSNGTQFRNGGNVNGQITPDGLCFGSDTAATNALDDYEEGSFTAAAYQGGSAITLSYHNTHGRYTKVGNMVTVWMWVRASGTTTSTGGLQIGGLPFTSNADSYRPALMGRAYGLANFSGNSGVCFWMNGSSSVIEVVTIDSNGLAGSSNTSNNVWASGAEIHCTFSYFV